MYCLSIAGSFLLIKPKELLLKLFNYVYFVAKSSIIITSISDLQYQQPLIRCATSLHNNGYNVLMIGRRFTWRNNPVVQPYKQKRIYCFFTKGPLQYIEYNIKLFFYLLFKKAYIITAVDLDTALPVYLVSLIKQCKRSFDARELFTELKEVVRRPTVKAIWLRLEKWLIPKFKQGIVVSNAIGKEYYKRYGVNYITVRNVPLLYNTIVSDAKRPIIDDYILFQGYVNEARGFDELLEAMITLPLKLVICGDGNYMHRVKALIQQFKLQDKVILTGMLSPNALRLYSKFAYCGIHLVEPDGLNQKYSLGNKFFDYIHAEIPQVAMRFIEYDAINSEHNIAILVYTITVQEVREVILELLHNKILYNQLKNNCILAKQQLNWQIEEKVLIHFYNQL
jgi:glycosyltransferase involved in cell wall biosynthesis